MVFNQKIFLTIPLFFFSIQTVSAQTIAPKAQIKGNIRGIFINPSGGVVNGVGTDTFTSGVGLPSRFSFSGNSFDVEVTSGYVYGPRASEEREIFSLGTLSYFNGATQSGTATNGIQLETTAQVSFPVGTNPRTFTSQLQLINTPNTSDRNASADSVFLPQSLPPTVLKTLDGFPLTLEIPGFGSISGGGFSTIDRFFVLEGQTAQAELLGRFTPPCEPIIDGAVTTTIRGATMRGSFTPNFNLSLSEAADLCGYDHFNWYQVIDNDPYAPGGLSVPYVDPPIGGGAAFGGFADSLPYYWDEEGSTSSVYHLSQNITATTLFYQDTPSESKLQPGEFLGFNTFLVGVLPDDPSMFDFLYGFSWKSDFNGTVGGVSSRRTIGSTDSGGTGGIFDLQLDLNPEDVSEEVREFATASGARNASVTISPNKVPEPSTWLGLILFGGIGLWRRCKS